MPVPAAAAPVLSATGVWWRHGRRPWLIEDLTVDLAPGALLRVQGGNGSGKSSLLRLLAGCVEPQRGTVRRSARAGYLPQLARSLPAVPARRLSALLAGRAGPADEFLHEHLGTRADRLSAGTARRVLLDAVLALPTPLLVLDEPAAGLDAPGVQRLATVLGDRLAAGSAVVLADHRALPLAEDQLLDLGGSASPSSRARITLAGTGTFRGRPDRDGVLQLTVPAGERDELLLAALRAGWSVVAVEPHP